MNEPVYLRLSILELSELTMYGFLYDYVKPWKPNYVTWFTVYKKMDDIYIEFAKDVETRFDTSNYELDRSLPKGEGKKVIGVVNDELGGKIMEDFFGLRAKTYSFLVNDCSEGSKSRKQVGHKKKN